MIFYNGFNLLLDIIFVIVAFAIGKAVAKRKLTADYYDGYIDGYRQADKDHIPF
jgi:hypothetical protein